MIRRHLTLFFLLLVVSFAAYAVPQPWMVSNIGPDGNGTRLRDIDGELLEGEVLIEYYVDREGDGIDPVLANGRRLHPDTDDDSVLVSALFSMPQAGFVPAGSFAFFFTVDTESDAQLDLPTFVRIYNTADITPQSRFTTSFIFTPRAGLAMGQTQVELPAGMFGYIDNAPPSVTLLPLAADPVGGEIFLFEMQVDDDEPPVLVEALIDEGVGTVSLELSDEHVVSGRWQVPVDLAGEFTMPIVISDGQFYDTTLVELDVLPAGDRPSSFTLLTPQKGRPAFSGMPLHWQNAVHPDGETITYRLQWSTGSNFDDGEWVDGLDEPELTLTFTDPAPTREVGELGQLQKRTPSSASKRTDGISDRTFPGERAVDETTVYLPIAEGTRFIWRVRAEAEDGSYRDCSGAFSAWAEFADAPSSPLLVLPVEGIELEDANPSFLWQSATDPDMGDELIYELLISADDGASWDTLHAGSDTTWQTDETELVSFIAQSSIRSSHRADKGLMKGARPSRVEDLATVSAFSENAQAVKSELAGKRGKSGSRDVQTEIVVDELPQDVTLRWKVDAVDLAGLRTSSSERTLSVVIPDRPTHFDLASPAPGTIYRGGEPVRLSWSRSVDPDPSDELTYSIFIAEAELSNPAPEFERVAWGLTTLEWTFELPDQDPATWRWRVAAISGEDTTWNTGGDSHFFVRPVYQPSLLEPVDDVVIEGDEITFRWAFPAGWADARVLSTIQVYDHPAMVDPLLEVEIEDTFHVAETGFFEASEYWWQVAAQEQDGNVWMSDSPGHFIVPINTVAAEQSLLPTEFAIVNAYPNPFNPSITIVVGLPQPSDATLSIYNILGRQVHHQSLASRAPGYHPLSVNLAGHAAGIYMVHLRTGEGVDLVQRVVLLK